MEVVKPKAKGGKSRFASVFQDVRKEKEESFFERMKDYPCSFNIGHADVTIDGEWSENLTVEKPHVCKDKWKYLIGNLKDDDEDDFEEPYWKENLLTRAYKEAGPRKEARRLNQETLARSRNRNLVALANKAFLHYFDGQIDDAYKVIEELQGLKRNRSFKDLKIDAVSEQAYSCRKFGGAMHLLTSLSLLGVALQYRRQNEKLQFMKAMVLRRCTHFHLYSEDPERIDRSKFCLEAANSLKRLGTQARSKSIRAAALIELAYLHHDDYFDEFYTQKKKGKPMLNRNVWNRIVGSDNWKTLCDKAIAVESDQCEKVLKVAGQLYRYAGGDENLQKSVQMLLRAIDKKPTNRAHHHLALAYRRMAIIFERNNNPQTRRPYQRTYLQMREDSRLRFLPEPPADSRPETPEHRLMCLTKIPKQNLKPFGENNPYTPKAVEQFKKAVEVSCRQNRPAFFDLAMMYAQMGKYDECLKTCQILIDDSTEDNEKLQEPLITVSVFNLYGMCCAMKADRTTSGQNKEDLLNESENMFMYAVRMASQLASEIAELKTCASDLWVAFETLERKFKFHGSKSSREKLFKLCELIADYRYLQIVDEIISIGESEYLTPEAVENCLDRYINLNDFKGAMTFNEMIPLRTGGTLEKITWCASVTMQKLMLGYAEQLLSKPILKLDNGEHLMQRLPVWKDMFYQEFLDNDSESIKLYDVVIVQDVGEDWQPRPGSLSDTAAKVLKDVLEKVCGLRVARTHEDTEQGQKFDEECKVISNSHMAIFVLADDSGDTQCKQLYLPDNEVKPKDRKSHGRPSSRRDGLNTTDNTLPKQLNSNASLQHDQQDQPTSAPFNFIFKCCIAEHVEYKQPAHIVLISVGDCDAQLHALPPLLRSFRSSGLSFTEEDIVNLSRVPLWQRSKQTRDLIMKLFKAIVRKSLT